MIYNLLLGLGITIGGFYFLYYGVVLVKCKKDRTRKEYCTSVSIVVPTFNEEATILQKLQNLKEQTFKGSVEIIVVDSGSTDRTVRMAEDFEKTATNMVILQQKERKGKASALNMAFSECTGEIVVITDADALWETDTLQKAISNFSDPHIGAVTGRQVLLNPDQTQTTKIEKTYRKFYERIRVAESNMDSTPIFHGEIACYKKDLLESISEDSMADDSELALIVRKKGFKTIYDPESVFFEYAPPTFASRFTQKVRRGQGLIQLFMREWRLLFSRKLGIFGLVVFPAEFFMHVVSPVLVVLFLVALMWSTALNLYTGIVLVIGIAVSLVYRPLFNIATSFLQSQCILLTSLVYLLAGKSQNVWPKVEEVRTLWQNEKVETEKREGGVL